MWPVKYKNKSISQRGKYTYTSALYCGWISKKRFYVPNALSLVGSICCCCMCIFWIRYGRDDIGEVMCGLLWSLTSMTG